MLTELQMYNLNSIAEDLADALYDHDYDYAKELYGKLINTWAKYESNKK